MNTPSVLTCDHLLYPDPNYVRCRKLQMSLRIVKTFAACHSASICNSADLVCQGCRSILTLLQVVYPFMQEIKGGGMKKMKKMIAE